MSSQPTTRQRFVPAKEDEKSRTILNEKSRKLKQKRTFIDYKLSSKLNYRISTENDYTESTHFIEKISKIENFKNDFSLQ